jgi:hypothetical protein
VRRGTTAKAGSLGAHLATPIRRVVSEGIIRRAAIVWHDPPYHPRRPGLPPGRGAIDWT